MIIGVGNGQFMLMYEMGTGVPLALSGDTQLSLAASVISGLPARFPTSQMQLHSSSVTGA